MPQIDTFARQAWQLRQQGHTLRAIAEALGKSPRSVERWISEWDAISSGEKPSFQGLEYQTVSALRRTGIDSHEALLSAWDNGEISRGHSPGIGVVRLVEIRRWLESEGADPAEVTPATIVVDLTAEAEAALRHLRNRSGDTASRIISDLLVKHDAIVRRS
jgi:hypothetical protein